MDFEYEINKWWSSNGDKLIEYADAIVPNSVIDIPSSVVPCTVR